MPIETTSPRQTIWRSADAVVPGAYGARPMEECAQSVAAHRVSTIQISNTNRHLTTEPWRSLLIPPWLAGACTAYDDALNARLPPGHQAHAS